MISKKLVLVAAALLSATTAAFAHTNDGWYGGRHTEALRQKGYYGTPYGPGPDYGYGGGDQFGYGPGYSYGRQAPDDGGIEAVR